MIPIVLVGAGGHCRSCIDVIEMTGKFEIVGIVGQPEEIGGEVLGYSINYTDDQLSKLVQEFKNFVVTVGQIKSCEPRASLFRKIKSLGGQFPSIISPTAQVSRHASVGEGTIAMHMCAINAGAKVAMNCIVNSKSLIEHDAQVGDHCHVSTGAILNGGSIVEAKCFIGSNAVLHQQVRVQSESVIGSGSEIRKDVPKNTMVYSRQTIESRKINR